MRGRRVLLVSLPPCGDPPQRTSTVTSTSWRCTWRACRSSSSR